MKRWIFIIIAIVILAGAAVGIVLGVKSCNEKKESEAAAVVYEVDYLKSKYYVGESIILRVRTSSKHEFTKISYSLNNGAEKNFTVEYGESKDFSETIGRGNYHADTGTELLPTDQLSEGWYTFMIYATEADGTRHVLTTQPMLIQLVAQPAA